MDGRWSRHRGWEAGGCTFPQALICDHLPQDCLGQVAAAKLCHRPGMAAVSSSVLAECFLGMPATFCKVPKPRFILLASTRQNAVLHNAENVGRRAGSLMASSLVCRILLLELRASRTARLKCRHLSSALTLYSLSSYLQTSTCSYTQAGPWLCWSHAVEGMPASGPALAPRGRRKTPAAPSS